MKMAFLKKSVFYISVLKALFPALQKQFFRKMRVNMLKIQSCNENYKFFSFNSKINLLK